MALSFSFSLSRSSLGDLEPHRLNHRLGLRSNSFDDRPSSFSRSRCGSRSLSTSFSFSLSFPLSLSTASSFPLTYREAMGTGGTGGIWSPGLRKDTAASVVDGRIFELFGEFRSAWNSPLWERLDGVVGEVGEGSEVLGMRMVGRDFLRAGRASGGTRGGETREGDEGTVNIGCGGAVMTAGVTTGEGAGGGAGGGTCESPNPGGSAGSGGSGAAPPFASVVAALTGLPATTSETARGGAGGLRPNEVRSRSTA